MDRLKRNAEIVALVKAREIPMRKIAERYRLDVSSLDAIANEHELHLRIPDSQKGADQLRDASDARCTA
jgi:hypothetical protein